MAFKWWVDHRSKSKRNSNGKKVASLSVESDLRWIEIVFIFLYRTFSTANHVIVAPTGLYYHLRWLSMAPECTKLLFCLQTFQKGEGKRHSSLTFNHPRQQDTAGSIERAN